MKAFLASLGSSVLLAGTLTACSSKIPGQVGAMADRACACQSKECADKVEKEYQDYVAANAKVKGSKEDLEEVQGHYNRMRECIARARGAEPIGGATAAPEAAAEDGEPTPAAPATPAEPK